MAIRYAFIYGKPKRYSGDYVYGKGQATIGYNYYSAPTTNIIIKIQVISQRN